MSKTKEFFIRRDGEISGPFSMPLIRKQIQDGVVGGEDHIGRTESGPWKTVREVPSLESAIPPEALDDEWDELPAPERLLPASFVAAYEGEVWALGDYEVRQSWRYSPPERRWRPGPELPSPESWGGAAVLDGRLHVIGGAHWSPALDTHVWDDRVFTLRPGWSRGSD